jgi:uncharacterized delta-60 repeat protein
MDLIEICGTRGESLHRKYSCSIEPLESRRLLAAANILGSLDPSFDNDGLTFAPFNGLASADSIVVQSDGKVLVAGSESADVHAVDEFAIARFNPDGSIDKTFGGGDGLVTLDPLSLLSGATNLGASQATSIGVTASGQILVAGESFGIIPDSSNPDAERNFAVVVRLKKNGAVDTTYGTNGVAWSDFDELDNSEINAMALTSNGSAIVAGSAGSDFNGAVVAKFDPTGQLDSSFNLSGFNHFNVIGDDDAFLTSLALAKDGSIYVTGSAGPDSSPDDPFGQIANGQSDILIAKLNSAGQLADGFGADDNGRFAVDGATALGVDGSSDDSGGAIFVDPQGRVVVAAEVSVQVPGQDNISQLETALLRFDTDGVPDDTWGTNGIVAFSGESNQNLDDVSAAAAYGSKRYLFAGTGGDGPVLDAINSATGKPDATFGSAGAAGAKRQTHATAIAFGHDGSVFVATGQSVSSGPIEASQAFAGVMKLRSTPGTVSGIVYNDVNGDGTIEKGETPAAGQQVYLDFDSNGVRGSNEPIVTTDKNGKFTFANIGPGSYELRMVLPAGTRLSSSTLGYRRVSVVSSQTTASQRMLFTSRALISGTVFDDINSDGIQEIADGEDGTEDLTILVDLNGNGVADKGEPEVLTDASGNFVLPSLTPGKYPLKVLIPSGGVATTPVEQAVKVTSGQTKALKFGVVFH